MVILARGLLRKARAVIKYHIDSFAKLAHGLKHSPVVKRHARIPPENREATLKKNGARIDRRVNVVVREASGIISANLTETYADLVNAHRRKWQEMAAASLPYAPVATVGWDVTPRCEKTVPWPFPPSPLSGKYDYPYRSVVEGNTPALFHALCEDARHHCQDTRPVPYAVFVNAWNEWTEGSFLLPEERYGTAYLEAVRDTFGRGGSG